MPVPNLDAFNRIVSVGPQRPPEETLESSRQQDRKEALERAIPTTIARSPTTYQYPLTLENKEEFVHSVIFYINARSNTRVGAASSATLANNTAFQDAQKVLSEQYASENRLKSESADTFLFSFSYYSIFNIY